MTRTWNRPGPDRRPAGRASPVWAVGCLVGLAGWLGVTVYVAATNPDPSDATPILRTFALAGAVFIAVVLGAAAVQLRRSSTRLDRGLYLRLAVSRVDADTVAAAVRRARRTAPIHLGYAGVTSALMLATIGFGERGPYRLLLGIGFGLVLAWTVTAGFSLRTAFRNAGDLLAPLGLAMVEVPVAHSGRLAGQLGYAGSRHGRQVRISQTPGRAVTVVRATFPRRSLTSAARMAELTGLPARVWRRVSAGTGRDGVTVRRRGNGAGRWLLHDLLLAEQYADHLAGTWTSPGAPPAPGAAVEQTPDSPPGPGRY